MIRLIGLGLIAAAAAGYGMLAARSVKRELRLFEGFYALAGHLRLRIACFNQPLSEIYRDFTDEALEEAGFLGLLRAGIPFPEALLKRREALGLRPELFSLLFSFGQGLGVSYQAEQVRHCEAFLGEGEARLSALRAEARGRIRLVRGLSAAAAALTILLLW